jgi:hypothetical protein
MFGSERVVWWVVESVEELEGPQNWKERIDEMARNLESDDFEWDIWELTD